MINSAVTVRVGVLKSDRVAYRMSRMIAAFPFSANPPQRPPQHNRTLGDIVPQFRRTNNE
jgi:hypothetical protein